MSILYVLIPLGLVLVAIGVWAFFWAVGNGQFDDLESPGWSVLVDERQAGEAPAENDDATRERHE